MALTKKQFTSIVEDVMTDLPFVQWDRGIDFRDENNMRGITIYGWIDREEDSYKDFVLLRIIEQKEAEEARIEYVATSSAKYSREIHHRLFPDDDLDEIHNDCYRLEHKFEAENIIQQTEGGAE